MILLSFDIEEFDMPFEYQTDIPFETQMQVSIEGTQKILAILDKHSVKATFFCTARFALNAPDLVKSIVTKGHELASHTFNHSEFVPEDYLKSKTTLEEITQTSVIGFRMPRMQPVDNKALQEAGYIYNSSINPTYLPGRYNNFHLPRTYFNDTLLQVPASVTPWVRFPFFWLTFHNFPLALYIKLCRWTLRTDGYLNIYFHPWEFMPLKNKYNFPGYVTRNDNKAMVDRLDKFIQSMKTNYTFVTFKEFLKTKNLL